MKAIFYLMFLFTGISDFSQGLQEKNAAKQTIEEFFEAFHRQDSIALREIAHPSITMQSIAIDAEGRSTLSTVSFGNFLRSISSIPETTGFEEKLHSFDITVNGPMATVITPYSFWIDDKLSHCGVNTFQLFKESDEWKIIYIIDTRTQKGCDE